MDEDRYGQDVLAGNWRAKNTVEVAVIEAERDLVVEEVASGFVGAVVGVELRMVKLEDRFGKVRVFPIGPGFLIDGKPVSLKAPGLKRDANLGRARSASGSFHVADAKARVALPSRIYVEGRHDAELVEKVWGHDLRIEGVVVEYIEGVDNLDELVRAFAPGPGRRIGVLVDHLVRGSKESRIADAVAAGPHGAHVLVVGHPFVDVWQAVKPARVGLERWPDVPRAIEWKKGICQALGWPHDEQADIARAWQRILGQVRTFKDLEPALLGRVEQLIDFVTEPA
ncbi:DUF3097 family protein [Rathayibacter sp. PhB127]|uniref:DUF3097 domain-containing protein n=1 Tax=Rathayibacter sp. PhB127 TaxID=2485176 RepID=UPI000F4C8258|nr:DUF3097 domain-containing protein [Rathayibacter sp. PhB127]ROS25261.1 DUF3097 family protein [Rathayibacter sp. PhB127]